MNQAWIWQMDATQVSEQPTVTGPYLSVVCPNTWIHVLKIHTLYIRTIITCINITFKTISESTKQMLFINSWSELPKVLFLMTLKFMTLQSFYVSFREVMCWALMHGDPTHMQHSQLRKEAGVSKYLINCLGRYVTIGKCQRMSCSLSHC